MSTLTFYSCISSSWSVLLVDDDDDDECRWKWMDNNGFLLDMFVSVIGSVLF